jgi:histidinol phosphatase-like PHP family hydrolase
VLNSIPQVSSLLCGGQSLNLAHANRVILIDPWWNTTREEQAWGRVLRIGQKKKSHFVKIMTQKTIDDRVSQLQIFKEREIRHVLQDDGHTPQQLDDDQLQEMCVPRVQGKQGKKNCREHFPKCGAPRALKKRKHSDTAE